MPLVHPADGADNTHGQLGGAHFHREHGDWQAFIQGDVFRNVDGQGGLAHGGTCRQHNQIAGLQTCRHAVEVNRSRSGRR